MSKVIAKFLCIWLTIKVVNSITNRRAIYLILYWTFCCSVDYPDFSFLLCIWQDCLVLAAFCFSVTFTRQFGLSLSGFGLTVMASLTSRHCAILLTVWERTNHVHILDVISSPEDWRSCNPSHQVWSLYLPGKAVAEFEFGGLKHRCKKCFLMFL